MKFCWTTITVKDLNKSIDFYENIVGLKIENRFNVSSDLEIVFLGDGETKIELIYNNLVEDISFTQSISIGFETTSIEKTIEKLRQHNIEIVSGPFQPSPNIKFFYVLDPNGVMVQFVENII